MAAERIGDIFETEIKDLAFNGRAVGSNRGKIVFLDGGLPGERVKARVVKRKRQYSIGRVLEIIDRADCRVAPRCEHFDNCGGCTWQDLDYPVQLFYKRKQVVDCLEHIAKLKGVEVGETIPSPDIFYYRNKMEFSFNVADGGGFNLGLHSRGRYDKIFDVHHCHLQSPLSNDIIKFIRAFVREKSLPAYNLENHSGLLRFLMIREGKNSGQAMVNIVTADSELPFREELVERMVEEFPAIGTIVQNVNPRKANIAKGETEKVLYGRGYIEEEILGNRFRIYANTFFQTNSRQAENLYRLALETLEVKRDDYLLDLYCGTGTIGICGADRIARAVGVELEEEAVRIAEINAAQNDVGNISFYAGSVQEVLRESPSWLKSVTGAVIDPPRAGMHPKALKQLLSLNINRVVYVSCNPATFARDAAAMVAAGYQLKLVTPVDMFPHTMHIELVAGFVKNN
jgi:23S rRNA (uracil1939-C5)-methyltransferase